MKMRIIEFWEFCVDGQMGQAEKTVSFERSQLQNRVATLQDTLRAGDAKQQSLREELATLQSRFASKRG